MARATVGDSVSIEANVFADGHDVMCCSVRYRHDEDAKWSDAPMQDLGNDRWRAIIPIEQLGRYRFKVRAAIDRYATWQRDFIKRAEAGQDLTQEYLVGAQLLQESTRRFNSVDQRSFAALAERLRERSQQSPETIAQDLDVSNDALYADVLATELRSRIGALEDPANVVTSETYWICVDPAIARFSTWYEMFPRSSSPIPDRHGTFADVESRLDYVAFMGFDVLYLPPIHPIGRTGRKGRDGWIVAGADDPGSPWAIGAAEGGHTAVHPQLGTVEDFRKLVGAAAARHIRVAIDLAFQTSPDHPWVQEHPEWFRHLPDGSIRYAENPPKRYEDIYPLDFEGLEWRALWYELLEVVRFWIDQGVTVFRVDNPHTKPFPFWEWLLTSVRAERPDVIFLAEAFTRPRVMEHLAKIGFNQSYTYFTWRTSKWEIENYLRELTTTDVAHYFRPNFWPNTPDILSEELQVGGRAAFVSRLILAATLSANYGLYGPTFELQEHLARAAGSEEYLHSEKYEVRSWDLTTQRSLSRLIALVNQIRHAHPALQFNDSLHFHSVDNENVIAYSKTRAGATGDDIIVTVVNLDHAYAQAGWLELDATVLNFDPTISYVMHDLLSDARFEWRGTRNFVKLDPAGVPAHIFSLEQVATSEASP
jgi:starch synthase (maltosyl-transferring)